MAGVLSMTVRKTVEEGLDFYPTQPWVTRAFVDHIKPQGMIWEPACGGGHMAEVLRETNPVHATDIHDYGYHALDGVHDFMGEVSFPTETRWIVTNPPFQKKMSERFVFRGLTMGMSVAVLCRLSWLEGSARFRDLFSTTPPTQVLVVVDRLGFEEGTCQVDRRGLLPYAWYVWVQGRLDEPTTLSWIPPGAPARYSHDDDKMRFNGPVVRKPNESGDHSRHAPGGPGGQSDLLGFFD